MLSLCHIVFVDDDERKKVVSHFIFEFQFSFVPCITYSYVCACGLFVWSPLEAVFFDSFFATFDVPFQWE